jgi:hypothetical protein
MRSRAVGAARDGMPEVVLVQGMAVADYLLPGLAAWGDWTRGHLLELRGLSGSGDRHTNCRCPSTGKRSPTG